MSQPFNRERLIAAIIAETGVPRDVVERVLAAEHYYVFEMYPAECEIARALVPGEP